MGPTSLKRYLGRPACIAEDVLEGKHRQQGTWGTRLASMKMYLGSRLAPSPRYLGRPACIAETLPGEPACNVEKGTWGARLASLRMWRTACIAEIWGKESQSAQLNRYLGRPACIAETVPGEPASIVKRVPGALGLHRQICTWGARLASLKLYLGSQQTSSKDVLGAPDLHR